MNLDQALEESGELISMWLKTQRFPDSPPFAGGVLDCWPNWAVEAFSIARLEQQRVNGFLQSEARHA